MTTRTQELTAAFDQGYAHCRASGLYSRRLSIAKNLRTFWEAGYEKAQAEIAAEYVAYTQTPEYAAQQAADRKFWDMMNRSVTAMSNNDYHTARKLLNESLGISR